jgi:hypothetical protein
MTTEVLLNFDGGFVEEAQGTTLTTDSVAISTLQSKFGSSSLSFTNGAGKLTVNNTVTLVGDFTIECWFYPLSLPSNYYSFIGRNFSSADALGVGTDYPGKLRSNFFSGTSVSSNSVVINSWNHAAYVRSGIDFFLFLNGVKTFAGSEISGTPTQVNTTLRIGGNTSLGVNNLNVYIDALRVIKDKSIYTQSFAVPTSPPTIAYPLFNEFTTNVNSSLALRSPLTLATPLKTSLRSPLYINRVLKEPAARFYYDPYTGTHRVTGTTKAYALGSNIPISRRVQLIDDISGNVVRQAWSDPLTGVYSFDNILSSLKYSVVSYDHTGLYKAVIADNLTPTSMP